MKRSEEEAADDVDLELLKAVAQAWHAQSGNPRPSRASEDDAGVVGARPRAGAVRYRPSRFKLEAMAAAAAASPAAEAEAPPREERSWDFARSLWDAYELVSVARKLESGLIVSDYDAPVAAPQEQEGGSRRGAWKRDRESGHSLRRLFLGSSSRRFDDTKK